MDDCLFCKIVQKEIPNYTVYENDHVLAFLDIHPCVKGHAVVIPKTHAQTLADMSDEQAAQWMVGVKAAAAKVQQVLQPDGYNIGMNHGRAAGNSIDHLHMHILPRWSADGGEGSMHTIINKSSDVPVEELSMLFDD